MMVHHPRTKPTHLHNLTILILLLSDSVQAFVESPTTVQFDNFFSRMVAAHHACRLSATTSNRDDNTCSDENSTTEYIELKQFRSSSSSSSSSSSNNQNQKFSLCSVRDLEIEELDMMNHSEEGKGRLLSDDFDVESINDDYDIDNFHDNEEDENIFGYDGLGKNLVRTHSPIKPGMFARSSVIEGVGVLDDNVGNVAFAYNNAPPMGVLRQLLARADYALDPEPRLDVVLDEWKWRSDMELAKEGLFRSKSYRPELNKPKEDGCEIGSRQVGLLFQKNEGGKSFFVRDDELWACRFNELLRYKQKFHSDNIMSSIEGSHMWEYNRRLARWVYTQRQQYARLNTSSGMSCKSHLTVKRIEALNAIGFVWNEPEFTWEYRFEQLKTFHNEYGHCRVPESYDSTLSKWVIDQRHKLLLKMENIHAPSNNNKINSEDMLAKARITKLDELGFVWYPHEMLWNERFKQLEDFVAKNGHTLVCRTDENASDGLASWVSRQRRQYRLASEGVSKRSALTKARIKALNRLGFVWDITENRFEQKLHELMEYKRRHGDCLVPYKYELNTSLGGWVSDLRSEYKKFQNGGSSLLTERHITLLEKVGFVWESQVLEWDDMLGQLKEFKSNFGHCSVPQSYEPNPKLGRWVHTQRSEFKKYNKGMTSKITMERVQQLDAIGFVWNPQETKWRQNYDALLLYVQEHGTALVPRTTTHNKTRALGRWVDTQRQQYQKLQRGQKSSMTQEKIALLESIGFVWSLLK